MHVALVAAIHRVHVALAAAIHRVHVALAAAIHRVHVALVAAIHRVHASCSGCSNTSATPPPDRGPVIGKLLCGR